jgi:hypothetical protein
LTFDYKIVTEDSLLEAGDYLQIEINGSSVQRIGWQQAASGCLGQPNILTGTYSVDLLGLGYQRGDSITFGVFVVIVDQYYNTYGYIDNVRCGTPSLRPSYDLPEPNLHSHTAFFSDKWSIEDETPVDRSSHPGPAGLGRKQAPLAGR